VTRASAESGVIEIVVKFASNDMIDVTSQERKSFGTFMRKFMQDKGQCFEVLQVLEQSSALI
jgi:hypothetical protein